MGQKKTSEYIEVEKEEETRENRVESRVLDQGFEIGDPFGTEIEINEKLVGEGAKGPEMENAESKPKNGIMESGVDRKPYDYGDDLSPGEGVQESIENSLPDNNMPF